ncbi:MAG: NAD-dependent epimerase/dehydratase family protein [Pyrinomonadaceae bacterium]|nr:NAD-dependent epimerase/dehydratase family protein [Pyrinomonadaceae bacterium]
MSDFNGGSVLVTGGAGFIGSHLVEALVRLGAEVTVLDNLSSGHLKNLVAVKHRVDLRTFDLKREDIESLLASRNFEMIFHLAGHADVPYSVQNPIQDFEKNALGTLHLIEAIRHLQPQAKVLFASSAAVYGDSSGNSFREEDPTWPIAPYGVSKLTAERYIDVYARSYSLRTASLRLFPVYGPRLSAHVVYDLIRKVFENPHELFIHGDGTQVRDFNYVTNAVEAFLLVAERGRLRGEVYNVAAGEPMRIKDIAQLICEGMSAAPRFIYSGNIGTGVSHQWSADISRLRNLGYHPRVGTAEGLALTVAWFRQEMAVAELRSSALSEGSKEGKDLNGMLSTKQ